MPTNARPSGILGVIGERSTHIDGTPRTTAALSLHNLTVAYRGHPAVHHVTGSFVEGSATAIVGPNGAGKSSLLAAIGGLIRNGRHAATLEGRIERAPNSHTAFLPQAVELDRHFPVRVHDMVAMGLWAQIGSFGALRRDQTARVEQALHAVGLRGFEQRLVGELSSGQVQRALFARVLVQDAPLILLDEPFNAIDARTTADLLALLPRWKREGRTVIAVLHDLDQVRRHFDQALLLAREPVAWGPTAAVLSDAHLARARQMSEAWDETAGLCEVTPSALGLETGPADEHRHVHDPARPHEHAPTRAHRHTHTHGQPPDDGHEHRHP
jgi:zinc/manganese transport system ATP-binding protein